MVETHTYFLRNLGNGILSFSRCRRGTNSCILFLFLTWCGVPPPPPTASSCTCALPAARLRNDCSSRRVLDLCDPEGDLELPTGDEGGCGTRVPLPTPSVAALIASRCAAGRPAAPVGAPGPSVEHTWRCSSSERRCSRKNCRAPLSASALDGERGDSTPTVDAVGGSP